MCIRDRFGSETPAFDVRISADAGHRLTLVAFRVRFENGLSTYAPLSLIPEGEVRGGAASYRTTVPASRRDDYLLLVGAVGAIKGMVPENIRDAADLISIEVKHET